MGSRGDIFCFLPVAITIVLGQDSIILLALSVGAFILMEKGNDLGAGLLFSLGSFKFQLIAPVILLFLLWKRWRFTLGATLGAAVVVCLSFWTAGSSGMLALLKTLEEMSFGLTGEAQKWKFGTDPGSMPNLRGLIDAVAGPHLSFAAVQVVVALCSLAVILIACGRKASFPLALLVAVLVSYHGFIHDASLLILPLGMVLVRSVREGNLLLGTFDLIVFATPVVLFVFYHSRYFPFALLLLALLLVWKDPLRSDDGTTGAREGSISGSAGQKLLA